jgi:hypothetical protein
MFQTQDMAGKRTAMEKILLTQQNDILDLVGAYQVLQDAVVGFQFAM